jgi:hypothetical protein
VRLPQYFTSRFYDPPLRIAATDQHGRAVVEGIGADDDITVTIVGSMGDASNLHGRPSGLAKAGETELMIELSAVHSYRWRLVAGEAPAPAEGESLALLPFTNSGRDAPAETATVRGSYLWIENVPVDGVACYARTQDGRIARIHAQAGDDEVRDASFRYERHIEVRVMTADGTPAEGVFVVVRDQGNNPIQPPAATDSEGVVRFERLHGMLADVSVVASARERFGGLRVGSVNLDEGSGSLEITLPVEREITVRVTVDGRPGLPTNYMLWGGTAKVVSEDPVTGHLRLRARPQPGAEGMRVTLRAPGYQAASVDVPSGSAGIVDLALVAGGSVRSRILVGERKPKIQAERWDAGTGRWGPVRLTSSPYGDAPDANGMLDGEGLAPGTYRLRDTSTGATTSPVDVRAGETADLGTLDVSASGYVTGTVTAPPGLDISGVNVVVEGEGFGPPPQFPGRPSKNVRPDGTFRVLVPGDRDVRLRVVHPTLRPTADQGVIEVREPRDGVTLRLERGPVVRVRAQAPMKVPFGGQMRVFAYEGEPGGKPVFQRTCAVVNGGLEFGVPRAGTFTLWIDAAPYAPLILRGVELGDDDVDLGQLTFPVGSTIHIKCLLKDGSAAPRLAIWAHRMAEPMYSRGLNSGGGSEIDLRGLGPGKFTVNVIPMMGSGQPSQHKYEFELDGNAQTIEEITLDLR